MTAGIKISMLPAVPSATTADIFPVVQGGVTYQETLAQVQTLFGFTGGILDLAHGGTNKTLTADNGGIVYSDSDSFEILAHTTTANRILLSGNASAPAWSTAVYPATTTINQILYSSAANTITGLATANTGVLTTDSGGIPSITAQAALTRVNDTNVTLTLGGTPATSLLNAVSLTLGWSGQLSPTRGGTGASLTPDNGAIVYSNATTLALLGSTATAGKVLQSGSSAAPSWSTPTYPSASGTAGKILRADGTNNVYSTSTFADTYTASNLLYSNGANTVTGLATANTGVLTTDGSGVPSITARAALTKTDDTNITLTLGGTPTTALLAATSITAGWAGTLSTTRGGTGTSAPTAHTLPVAEGASAFTFLGPLTNGQLLIGSTGADPVPAAVTAGGGISITNAAGSITISATGGGFPWTNVTGTSQSMATDNGYIANNASLVTLTLPTTAAIGTVQSVAGNGAGGWKVAQNSSQNIHFGNQTTTTGVGGSLASTNQYDQVTLLCTVANTTWVVTDSLGALTTV